MFQKDSFYPDIQTKIMNLFDMISSTASQYLNDTPYYMSSIDKRNLTIFLTNAHVWFAGLHCVMKAYNLYSG
jgi:hypothetical protein